MLAIWSCPRYSRVWSHIAIAVRRGCSLQQVLIATDATQAGDKALHEWMAHLASYETDCRRLRVDGSKD